MEGNESVWSELASRALRVLLARKEASYADLAAQLGRLGVEETARGVEGKTQRGTYRFLYFLQSLEALHADYPAHWESAMRSSESWEQKASAILEQEIASRPWLTRREVSRRLQTIGEEMTPRNLSAHIRSGGYPATLFIQCAVVCSFDAGMELFMDRSDLRAAARDAMPKIQRGRRKVVNKLEPHGEG
ncbi:hypothetical protein AWB75_04149 [Caballeronia catudaia]|uniref:DUF6471 domain-containing protein n=1 Tax=Caballeronia catudaia TaxID=1777136 RepID=A0A158BWM1_9BURK|nr:DUF6471 domain-containing protein [Caballeronia catudaia]SAK74475.1 hypothetical protein AWB75_04149 [Caballeronia catudaia]